MLGSVRCESNTLVAVAALGLHQHISSVIEKRRRRGKTYALEVSQDHLLDELVERNGPLPAEDALRLGRSAVEDLDLSRSLCKV